MLKFSNSTLGMAVIAVFFLSACSTATHHAPVEDRRGGVVPQEVAVTPISPVVKAAPKQTEALRSTYVVKRGDTLYKIALDHGRNYLDLVLWNGLKNPNDIKVDQILKIAPPESGVSTGGVQALPVGAAVVPEIKPLSAAGSGSVFIPGSGLNKTMPKGDKRAYSESVLAELQKPDSVLSVPPVSVSVSSAASAPKVVEKQVENASSGDVDNIEWIWPVDIKPSGLFDESKNKGLDSLGRAGQDIHAAGSGRVMYVGSGIRGYGNLVILRHSNNLLSAYAHNRAIVVKEGQSVAKGQKIAEMGNSDSDTIKLHFEIRLNGKSVDPVKYLPPK